ncbi:tRNA uridine-5-carboxymethylaminomethyl(34) synthesis GTPase MnmE [Synechococcus sp. PCC 7336]|uniref:tRNA uridine-5-carboxymethylaminomethyl(34) synthesis GTPase MnmE n=1 Tax=Synechococcus sp. PCC 7336 TaxID=195250 RepID=UPI0003461D52|nr:tRNA uridine-5-carboxymethylaminomethyl(34) synthesis GTPase MnmE [Synechococcus sp. PCC 7336]
MSANPSDTIAAIATAAVPARGSVGIVRVSGPEALDLAKVLFHPAGKPAWDSHRILYGSLRDAAGNEIDEALLLWMQAPRSYTREDVVEFHCHGGIMVVQAALQACLQQGARLAEPGEFTLRAFLNGRIDLTQAESISQLVGSQSEQAAQLALAGVRGKLAQPIRELRSRCLDVLATVEAQIDFEDDLGPLDESEVQKTLEEICDRVAAILATAERGELLRRGLKVAIVGQPNVGKSSLLNAWSGIDRAIVTDLPGTTRDVVESQLVVEGMPVQVLDTAGIRETGDRVESLGIERSRQVAQSADLVILVVAAPLGWTAGDEAIYATVAGRPLLIAINKTDLAPSESVELPEAIATCPVISTQLQASEPAAQSIRALERAVIHIATQGKVTASNLDVAINDRQKAALLRAQASLRQVIQTLSDALPLDFWTIDLRDAVRALGEITGETVTESMLDRIFSQFCIGK